MRTSLRLCESATAESNARARPSQLRKLPLFSVIAATGNTTSATAVTELGAISSETTNDFLSASSAVRECGRSCASTPPTTTASRSPDASASMISVDVRPGVVGSDSTPHAAAISTRAAASATGRPPGRRLPSAPASSAPRSPARRGM